MLGLGLLKDLAPRLRFAHLGPGLRTGRATYFALTQVFDIDWENPVFMNQCSDSLRSIFRKKLIQYRFFRGGEGRKDVCLGAPASTRNVRIHS